MAKFVKKPVVVEAAQWFENGDHPEDGIDGEGKVVRRYRRSDFTSDLVCGLCQRSMTEHGWTDTLEGGHIVCPGDWIITGVEGERYPCKPGIFEATYEPADGVVQRDTMTADERAYSLQLRHPKTTVKVDVPDTQAPSEREDS